MSNFKTQDLCLSEDISELLCKIDRKISMIAKGNLDSIRYGVRCKPDKDKLFTLVRYKRILLKKLSNDSCLCNCPLDMLTSIIKQHLSL